MRASFSTQGIVLTRTDFNEADRILTFLTPDHGKLKVMAKGVRKAKAKLAGSIELFSVSDITVLPGRSEIDTLISARLIKHFANIVKDLNRTEAGYQFLKLTDKSTEAQLEPAYFQLLESGLAGLADIKTTPQLVSMWFKLQLLQLLGHAPNLYTDQSGTKLEAAKSYRFLSDKMQFLPADTARGQYHSNHVKFLRLALKTQKPETLVVVNDAEQLAETLSPLVTAMLQPYVRL